VREELEDTVKRLAGGGYYRLPIAFARDILHANQVDEFQREIACSLMAHKRVAVAGAKGIGKGYVAALIIWWFMVTRPFAKVGITSASATTVQTNVWGELAAFYRKSALLREMFDMGDRMIRSRRHPKEHFAIARQASVKYTRGGGARERQAEGLSGMYTRHVLWVLDEATAIDDAIYDTIATSVNEEGHQLLILFNPIRTSGFAWEIFNIKRKGEGFCLFNVPYHRSHIANTPAGAARREQWIRQWGENSALVAAFVHGRHPTGDAGDSAYSLQALYDAFSRVREPDMDEPLDIGIDPARHGSDECAFLAQRDYVGHEMRTFGKIDQDDIVEYAERLAEKWIGEELKGERKDERTGKAIPALSDDQKKDVRFRIDVGMGVGPIDFLKRRGYPVIGVDNGKKPTRRGRKENYASLGTELWIETASVLRQEEKPLALGNMIVNERPVSRQEGDGAMIQQLCQRPIVFPTNDNGRRRVMPKEAMRQNMSGSPDRGDVFVLAFGDITRMGRPTGKPVSTIA